MIRCFVLDDEKFALDILVSFISRIPDLALMGASTDVFEAINHIQDGEVDLLFLDIQMPELTGLQLLKIIGNRCRTILTTAYPDYALEGFELDVVDYLMKPVAFDRFVRAVAKVPRNESAKNERQFIMLKGDRKNKFHNVYLNEIRYIQGLKNYVQFFTGEGTIVSYQNLNHLEEYLPSPPFFRVHRSFIISLDHVRMIDGNSVYVGQQLIPIGESYQKAFLTYLDQNRF